MKVLALNRLLLKEPSMAYPGHSKELHRNIDLRAPVVVSGISGQGISQILLQ